MLFNKCCFALKKRWLWIAEYPRAPIPYMNEFCFCHHPPSKILSVQSYNNAKKSCSITDIMNCEALRQMPSLSSCLLIFVLMTSDSGCIYLRHKC